MVKKILSIKNTRIVESILDNDFKQKGIALKLNVKDNNYSKCEIHLKDIPLEMGNVLANIYNCTLDYLFYLSDNHGNIVRKNISSNLLSNKLFKLRKDTKDIK